MDKNIINSSPRQINVTEMAPHVHNFSYGENKVEKISKWLINWIEEALKEGKARPLDFLPPKADIAFHIGVSLGTIQNAYRAVEDYGLIESKQRIGSYIADKNCGAKIAKLTSKREYAAEKIKRYIVDSKLKQGAQLSSLRKLSDVTKMSVATIRNALNTLIAEGIIEKQNNNFIIKDINFLMLDTKNKTLVEKIASDIEAFIAENKVIENKLPSNPILAKKYGVSIKTIHDAIKILVKNGKVITRRGQYGTLVVNKDKPRKLYLYEEAEIKIKQYIMNNGQIGMKLPSINEFSQIMKVSAKTVKIALNDLEQDGYITFTRGRYGGTYVMDMPKEANETYTWLALTSDFADSNKN